MEKQKPKIVMCPHCFFTNYVQQADVEEISCRNCGRKMAVAYDFKISRKQEKPNE